ncbi:hypothetical protein ACJMK2_041431 [Sinanodonta woodiana]|uniref:Chloride channel CLIC-like protein 1 n=1 Tax=Sinanodonta woodiana TaxID=1069815 RepID=A0ABD3W447_SINWO
MWIPLMYLLMAVVCQAQGKMKQKEDRDDWINPHDMLNFDHSSKTMIKKTEKEAENKQGATQEPLSSSTTLPPLETDDKQSTTKETLSTSATSPPSSTGDHCYKQDQAALPLLKQYINTLLRHLDGKEPQKGKQDYNLVLQLSDSDIELLQRFVQADDQKHVHEVHEILTDRIQGVTLVTHDTGKKATLWIESRFGLPLEKLVQIAALMALASVVMLIEFSMHISIRRRVTQLIIFMFIVSVPMTWFELYQSEDIKRQTISAQAVPEECKTAGKDNFWLFVKSFFSSREHKCSAYWEHLLIDPVWKITPTKAIAVTIVRFFVSPLKDVGASMREFTISVFHDLPIQLYPIAIVMIGLFLFLFLFMSCGYSLHLPLISISPTYPPAISDSGLPQALTDSSNRLLAKLEQIEQNMVTTEENLKDKIKSLESVQKAAIEYTIFHTPTPNKHPGCGDSYPFPGFASPTLPRTNSVADTVNSRENSQNENSGPSIDTIHPSEVS